ncbi:hypothetical protein ACUY2L_11015, partial [Corynebacterium mastitidis]
TLREDVGARNRVAQIMLTEATWPTAATMSLLFFSAFRRAASEPGSRDRRDAMTVVMELLAEELGAKPL